MAWLDAGGCGDSDQTPQNGTFDLSSPAWTSTVSGTMLSADGHVHDGGENVTIYQNGNVACVSQHLYGRTSSYISPVMMDGTPGPMEAISDTSQCENFGTLEIGDILMLKAHYDTINHPIDNDVNGPMDIMGISKVSDFERYLYIFS